MIVEMLERWKKTTLFYRIQIVILFVMTAFASREHNVTLIMLGYLFILILIMMVDLYEMRSMWSKKN